MPITVPNTAAITAAVQTMLNSQKTALDTTINAARDNVKADTTTQLATQKTALDTTINAARDNVKADTTAQLATQTTAINSNTDTKTGAVTTAVNAKGAVKSVQRGVTGFSANGTPLITIAAVDINKSAVIVGTTATAAYDNSAALVSSTSLQIYGSYQNGTSCYWQVIEYF